MNETFRQAEKIAKKWAKTDNVTTSAVLKFTMHLNNSVMYFNREPFPKNESFEQASTKCFSYGKFNE